MQLLDQQFISITEAAKLVPGRVHISTCWRWINRGVRGHRLQTWMIGGLRKTTREALEDFLARLNPDAARVASVSTTRQRERAIAAAERELDAAGV